LIARLHGIQSEAEMLLTYPYTPAISLVPGSVWDFAGGSASPVRGGATLTFTRASAQTGFNSAGVMSSYATDVPVYDYNPTTLAPLGLSMWEARTNLFLNSALDGTALATQGVTTTAQAYTVSFYGTGSITFSGAFVGSLNGTGATDRVTTTFTPSAGTVTCTVSGSVKWANFEVGSFATPFIVTAGASATRAAPVCSTTNLGWYNQAEGTFVAVSLLGSTFAQAEAAFDLHDGSTANRIVVRMNTAGPAIQSTIRSGAATVATLTSTISPATTQKKLAIAYKVNDFSQSVSGETCVTDSAGAVPVSPTTLLVGHAFGPAEWLNGWVSSLSYYPVRIADATLQGLSA